MGYSYRCSIFCNRLYGFNEGTFLKYDAYYRKIPF